MKEIYEKINKYLNDICTFLEQDNSFLLDNIYWICRLNDDFLQFLNNYDSLDNEVVENKLTFEDVYLLAREIIETIDFNYLKDFDKLIETGELDFSYDKEYIGSYCHTLIKDGKLKIQLININRHFNYDDVVTLIHEFIHYTNTKKRTENVHLFTEFLSIYFETYAIDYLLAKGINKNEIDYLSRIKNTFRTAKNLYNYEIILLAFIKFGSIDENTIFYLREYLMNIKPEVFEKECKNFYEVLTDIEKNKKLETEDDFEKVKELLIEPFITSDYRYVIGTLLAFNAYKHSNLKDVVYLNNHIGEYDDKDFYDICLSIGIDLDNPNLEVDLFNSIIEYLNGKDIKMKTSS